MLWSYESFVHARCYRISRGKIFLNRVDGTGSKAVNSRACNFSRERLAAYLATADAQLDRYLAELDQIDRGEDGASTDHGKALATHLSPLCKFLEPPLLSRHENR